jgi:cytochrome c oxidase assembly protein subunit 15
VINQLSRGERLYFWLAGLTAALVLLLIILGAVVRVTDAESGCGGTWPLCDGSPWPSGSNELAWIDWAHRLNTLFTVLSIFGACYAARRFIRDRKDVTTPLYLGLGLLGIQSVLGAGTMLLHEPSTLPLVHLGFAVIMLSCLVASITALLYQPHTHIFYSDKFSTAVQGATLMIFMVLMTGALVVGSESSKVCPTWPLCRDTASEAAIINLIHRGSVLLLGITLLSLVWQVDRSYDQVSFTGAVVLLALYGLQVALGALYILSDFHASLSALHVTTAGLMWAAAVALNVVLVKQQQVVEQG